MKKFLRKMLGLGVLAALGYAIWRAFESRSQPSTITWEHQPFPYPPQPQRTEQATSGADAPAVDATDGTCPATHPIKAKLASGIYHVPGGGNYDRIRADRCYVDAAAAEADGLRPPKR